MTRYVLLTTTFAGGNRTYGIGYAEYDGKHTILLRSYPDLSRRAAPVRRLVCTCNRLRLDPVHLRDVVEDFLGSR